MKIIIVGVGKLGEYLARLLVNEKHEVTLIDLKFNGKESLINNEDVNYIEGNGLDSNILIEAGINNSDLLISVMKEDSENVMCSLIGKKLGAKNTIARIRSLEYSNSINLIKEELGLSMTINPEYLAASQIAQTLSIPSAIEATSFFKGKINVITLKITTKTNLENKSIEDISKKLKNNIIICAIERNEKIIIPEGSTKLKLNDIIHITGTRKDINLFLKYTKQISEKTKNVIIGGGSNIALYLSKMLIDMGIHVKIIENDINRCDEIATELPKALIINGDLSNQNILFEEGIKSCDAFVSLTSIDEENIVYSMFALSLNVPKVITKINHINLDNIDNIANINSIVTPHKIAANHVIQYVRAKQNRNTDSCEAIYTFGDNIFQISEFKIKEDFKLKNKKIKDLKFKENVLITAIQRDKSIIYPRGNDELKLNDNILIVTNDNNFKSLNDLVKWYEQ